MAKIAGIIGKKLGMTQIFDDAGNLQPVTAVEAGPCYVAQVKTVGKDGYTAIQIGFGLAKKLNSPEKGHLKSTGRQLKHLREFRVSDIEGVEVGHAIDVSIFKPGDRVDVVGISKGRGFQGGMKRHGFGGGPKTHGQSDRGRAPGSIGGTTYPGRVYKGQRMAGHMGNARITVRNLQVVEADVNRNLLLLKGAVPGADNGVLEIRKTSKGGRK